MGRLIDREKLIAEYDRVHVGPAGGARKLMEEAREVQAIPISWIEGYLDWLNSMDNDFATRNTLAISAMLKKWEMETDCGPDACEIGGQK